MKYRISYHFKCTIKASDFMDWSNTPIRTIELGPVRRMTNKITLEVRYTLSATPSISFLLPTSGSLVSLPLSSSMPTDITPMSLTVARCTQGGSLMHLPRSSLRTISSPLKDAFPLNPSSQRFLPQFSNASSMQFMMHTCHLSIQL